MAADAQAPPGPTGSGSLGHRVLCDVSLKPTRVGRACGVSRREAEEGRAGTPPEESQDDRRGRRRGACPSSHRPPPKGAPWEKRRRWQRRAAPGGLPRAHSPSRASVTWRAPQTPPTERLRQRSGWSLRGSISSRFPGDAAAAGRGPPPGASLQKPQAVWARWRPRHARKRSPAPAGSARPCEARRCHRTGWCHCTGLILRSVLEPVPQGIGV